MASEEELVREAGGEAWLEPFLNIRRLLDLAMREDLRRSRLGENDDALNKYLFATLRHLKVERLIAIFADEAGYILSEEVLVEGDEEQLSLSPRKLIRRAMNLDASRVLLAHNHPSGDARPSGADIAATRRIVSQAGELGITIVDHLIVAGRELFSMKRGGFL